MTDEVFSLQATVEVGNVTIFQNGDECRCSDNLIRLYEDEPAECTTPCAGNPAETCGGENSNDVYMAPRGRDVLRINLYLLNGLLKPC